VVRYRPVETRRRVTASSHSVCQLGQSGSGPRE
jgi:hypothetical protein